VAAAEMAAATAALLAAGRELPLPGVLSSSRGSRGEVDGSSKDGHRGKGSEMETHEPVDLWLEISLKDLGLVTGEAERWCLREVASGLASGLAVLDIRSWSRFDGVRSRKRVAKTSLAASLGVVGPCPPFSRPMGFTLGVLRCSGVSGVKQLPAAAHGPAKRGLNGEDEKSASTSLCRCARDAAAA